MSCAGIDQQPRADAFLQSVLAQVAHFARKAHQLPGNIFGHAALTLNDVSFDLLGRIVELDRHEALPRARFQVFEHGLIAGIVRYHELKIIVRFDDLTAPFDGQHTAVIR